MPNLKVYPHMKKTYYLTSEGWFYGTYMELGAPVELTEKQAEYPLKQKRISEARPEPKSKDAPKKTRGKPAKSAEAETAPADGE